MLRKILDEHHLLSPARSVFFPKIPDQFNEKFMKALANDAEIDGMVDKANEYILESIEQNEALNEKLLDTMWNRGVMKGHELGVDAGYAPGYNKGLVEGLLAGWADAKTFKAPNRV